MFGEIVKFLFSKRGRSLNWWFMFTIRILNSEEKVYFLFLLPRNWMYIYIGITILFTIAFIIIIITAFHYIYIYICCTKLSFTLSKILNIQRKRRVFVAKVK